MNGLTLTYLMILKSFFANWLAINIELNDLVTKFFKRW
jgi:hypothetical protein